nr:BamA/TamA family outer membrane protein [Synechococcus sp. RSCCF101]
MVELAGRAGAGESRAALAALSGASTGVTSVASALDGAVAALGRTALSPHVVTLPRLEPLPPLESLPPQAGESRLPNAQLAQADDADPAAPPAEVEEIEVEEIEVETVEEVPAPDAPPAGGGVEGAPGPAAEDFNQEPAEPQVLISEVVIEGLEGHPEQERLELEAYDAMRTRPGSLVTRSELRTDLSAIYATGWFSDVRIQPVDGPLGVQVVVMVTPNPVLTEVDLDPSDARIPDQIVADTFAADFGRTLNLNVLQTRMKELQTWYADEGFSLARVTGPERVSPQGVVELKISEGLVAGVEVEFLNREGENVDENGEPVRGKTRPWVITREISLQPGDVFNRNDLEADLQRLYGTNLFSDVKVSLKPVPETPGEVTILLGIVEQSTGSLSGGLGYSQSQGVFGQIQVSDSNLLGRAWNTALNFTYGQFGGLATLSFTDPWIRGDRHRTAFNARLFISREVPQIFQSQDNGNIRTASDFYEAPGTDIAYDIDSDNNPAGRKFDSVGQAEDLFPDESWYDYRGNTVALERFGGTMQFIRPMNGGDPFKRAPWTLVLGLNAQQVRPIDFTGASRRFGVGTQDRTESRVPTDDVICIAYNCASENQLVGLRFAATMNNLDDPRNPREGNFLSMSTEQFVSVGEDSPTFNRLRATYTQFFPVNWLKFYKGCRPEPGEPEDCKQALAFQVKAGTVIGDLPPYEAFCVGGTNSVRGYFECDLAVGRSFGEATIEYRFPIWSIISGEVFADAATDFSSQSAVPGEPGNILDKPGSGFSLGTGVIVTTPVGPLRLEAASRDLSGDWRFNLGVGWKF